MRHVRILLCAGAAFCARPAIAADALKFGAAPTWVHAQVIPPGKLSDAPVALLLRDEQVRFDRGKTTTYSEGAVKFQNAQGLAAGNVILMWQPATDTVTVNKLQIRRGDKVIDVLAGGQTFTILRRETNLDAATLDGTLTATLQPEGLQVGDIIDLATTTEHSDPVLKGHVEAMFGAWDGVPIQTAHAVLSWPTDMHLQLRQTPNLPAVQKSSAGGLTVVEMKAQDVQPLVPPKGAPARFKIGRLAEATDFAAWSDLTNLFSPLFRDASAIPASGPLHDEVERIRSASNNPKMRAEQALALVQDRVRYVALLMGQGGYVPAKAELTWSRRFGDCKAKTALLLGILHSLGIDAEPVIVHANSGDMIADRLPMVALFNHVLVRAHIGGKDYWLDGTRSGDTDLDAIEVPDFGWGLPIVANAKLVQMVPAARSAPNLERRFTVDASDGVYAPAAVSIEETYRGDSAVEWNTAYSALTTAQRDEQMHDEAKAYFDSFTVGSSSFQFDKAKREMRITIKGTAKLNWKDGWSFIPNSTIAFDPDFDRPPGALHDAPWAINHPKFVKDEAVIRLPAGFAAGQTPIQPVHQTLAGVEYARSESVNGDVLSVESSERSVAPEVPYKDALAAATRLKSLYQDDVYLRLPANYQASTGDLPTLADQSPSSADAYVVRGSTYLNGSKYDEAIADFDQALKLDATNKWAFANRGFARTWKHQFEDAEKDFAAAEQQNFDRGPLLQGRGLLAELKGNCGAAVDLYTRSLAAGGDAAFGRGHRALCEARTSKEDEAVADAAEALKLNPSWSDLRLLRANILMQQGKRDLVAAEAEAWTRANPDSDFAWVGAARIHAAIGQRGKAMDDLGRALALKQYPYIYVNRSQVRPHSDLAGRMADLDAALKLERNNADALAEKARLLTSTGDYKGALAALDGMKANPDNAYLQMQRAVALYKAGRVTEANTIFAGLRSKAKLAVQLNNLCWSKAIAGVAVESALADCRDALKLAPDFGPYLDSLGMALLKLGRLDEALDAYNKAIAKNTGADSLMGRAFVYLRKGDRTHAEADAAAARKVAANIDDTFADYGLTFDKGPAPSAKQTTIASAPSGGGHERAAAKH